MEDKISIILPIFNVGDHLRGGIDSLINQTIGNENLEIIMVNDCSTDGSGEIIDEYAAKGYRYVGYIPVEMTGHGQILEMDLIFEIEE